MIRARSPSSWTSVMVATASVSFWPARGRGVVGTEPARAADGLGDRPPHVGAVRHALTADDGRAVRL